MQQRTPAHAAAAHAPRIVITGYHAAADSSPPLVSNDDDDDDDDDDDVGPPGLVAGSDDDDDDQPLPSLYPAAAAGSDAEEEEEEPLPARRSSVAAAARAPIFYLDSDDDVMPALISDDDEPLPLPWVVNDKKLQPSRAGCAPASHAGAAAGGAGAAAGGASASDARGATAPSPLASARDSAAPRAAQFAGGRIELVADTERELDAATALVRAAAHRLRAGLDMGDASAARLALDAALQELVPPADEAPCSGSPASRLLRATAEALSCTAHVQMASFSTAWPDPLQRALAMLGVDDGSRRVPNKLLLTALLALHPDKLMRL
jgi:hypothetical protein